MKKIFLYLFTSSLFFIGCNTTETPETYTEPESIATQNTYDDESIQKFLDQNYMDELGRIKPFSASDASDDTQKKLSELNPIKLNSGVIYIKRTGAQPEDQPTTAPGTTITPTDSLKIMMRATTFLAGNLGGETKFLTSDSFTGYSPLDGTGVPVLDPMFFHVTQEEKTKYGNTNSSFYEIEGFKEALLNFKSFNKEDEENYNLQGVIIVPSRAAFARDDFYNYSGYSLRNRTFVFNFQLYKAIPRN